MTLPGKLCVGILEEDNPLKSYFRFKPLLVAEEGGYLPDDEGELAAFPEPEEEPEPEEKPAPPVRTQKMEKSVKKEPAKEAAPEKPAEPTAQSAETAAPAAEEKARPAYKTYHVSKRKAENKWQVKMAGGAKAIKMFITQAEAIDFAKKLAENQEAKIVIHKEDGTFRRLTYHKKK